LPRAARRHPSALNPNPKRPTQCQKSKELSRNGLPANRNGMRASHEVGRYGGGGPGASDEFRRCRGTIPPKRCFTTFGTPWRSPIAKPRTPINEGCSVGPDLTPAHDSNDYGNSPLSDLGGALMAARRERRAPDPELLLLYPWKAGPSASNGVRNSRGCSELRGVASCGS
jgi:hypothetical protein